MIADALAEDRIDRLEACIQACEGVPSRRLKPGRMADAEAVIAELRAAITELLAAEDAVLAFSLNCDPGEIGQIEWLHQHRECSSRRTAAIAKARALSTTASSGGDDA